MELQLTVWYAGVYAPAYQTLDSRKLLMMGREDARNV
jgi:hypothetical protein